MTHLERVALRKMTKAGATGDLMVVRFQRLDCGGCLLSGGPARVLTRGKDKGHRRVEKITHRVVVTDAEVIAEEARFEAETGLCRECQGKGEVFARWSVTDGTSYRPCRRCAASGKVVQP